MKWILENAAKLIGLLSFGLVVFSTIHDWGYFSVIGSHYRALLSAYDYVTNAIEWMPAFALTSVFGAALSYLLASLIAKNPEGGFGDQRRKLFKRRVVLWSGF